ncbi:uncharacterized protein LOC133129359 isoform X1 [Conger conger]|uniref:uncharacterized protein LOC133129359 isoform X1 n=1 Tax=Conger conger TaxID=82655 RepID=UPI002A5A962C|nr:uncharacterized protein LOC133129359 isoform X1 [Conger conger]
MKAIDPFFMGKNDPRKKSTESSTTQEESLHKSPIGSCDSGYDSLTQQSSLSFPDPPQEAQRELGTGIGTLIPPSERKQSDPDEAANGATDMAVKSAAATSVATPRATASAATTAVTASAATVSADTTAAIPAATASAATASADTTAATPAATASAAKPADIVSATTTAATSSAATSATSAATAEATNSAASRAATASADTSATSAAKPAETVAANGGRPNYGNPKKQQSGQVCKKSILTNEQKAILRKFLIKQIPSEKLGTEEELKEIIACITIMDFHDHPRYPLLRAYDCIVFRDPKTNQRKLVEILNDKAYTPNGNLKKDLNFKVQFHMWLLELSEALLLSEKEETEVTQSFQPEEKTFRQYLHDLVVPVLAVYKKARLENELSTFKST